MKPLLWAVVALLALKGAARGADRPNILFCIADDQSFPHASAYGTTWVKTPAFDRVAREGLLFMRAYTPNAKCGPSRSCVLTGRNSYQLEAAANHNAYYPKGYRTFMEALGRNGYFVGYTGKPWAPGNMGEIDGHPRLLNGPAYNEIKDEPPTSEISPIDYAANFAAFLRRRPKGEPFCFWYGGHEPHRPYEFMSGARINHAKPEDIPHVFGMWPDDATVRNDLLDYAEEIQYFDQHLGRMLDQLAAAGELDNTIVVVTSDNGMPFPRSKGTAYEISNHMPLAIRWPKGIRDPGRRVEGYVSHIDFAATFLDVAGLTAAAAGMEPIQGKSLVPIFEDPAAGALTAPGRDEMIIGQERHDVGRPDDVGYPIRGLYHDGFLYLCNFEPSRWPMGDPITGYLNTDGGPTKSLVLAQNRLGINHWMWVLDFDRRPAEELYDLRRDPECLDNRIAEPALQARRKDMQAHLFQELREQGDPRMRGEGAVFDRYPYGQPAMKDFYTKYVLQHKKLHANWVEDSDFEAPGFDPERPVGPAAAPLKP